MIGSSVALRPVPLDLRYDLAFQAYEQFIEIRLRVAQHLDLFDGVADGGMVPPVIESSDPSRAPPSHMLGKVHRDLPIENRRLCVTADARVAESRRNHLVYCGQRDALTPMSRRSFIRNHGYLQAHPSQR